MVSSFCGDKLTDEYADICTRLVEKMGRKHEVPFKRGKLENWASGVVYAIAQINFLFDKSFEPSISADDICDYFNTKKSTASNKARDIRKMFNLGYYDSEFSSQYMLSSQPRFYQDPSGLIVPESMIIKNDELEVLMDMINENPEDISEGLNLTFITALVNSVLFCAPIFEGITFLATPCGSKFFAFFTSREEFAKTFPDLQPMPFSFYDFCEIVYESDGELDFEGVKLNPDSQDLFISMEMMCEFYEMFG